MKQFTLGVLFSLALCCITFGILFNWHIQQDAKIDLPEEWSQITDKDNLKGYMHEGILHLYFSNPDNAVIEPEYIIELTPQCILVQTEENKIIEVPYHQLDEFIDKDNL